MRNKRTVGTLLCVKAVGLVREIDIQDGMPLPGMRFVGRDANGELLDNHVIPYHAVYIKHLMDGDLLPLDSQTAQLAGISWTA